MCLRGSDKKMVRTLVAVFVVGSYICLGGCPRVARAWPVHTTQDRTAHRIIDSLPITVQDTDEFAWVNTDFSRFTIPGECVAAAMQKSAEIRRALSVQYSITALRDTAPERDTLPREVIVLAMQCGAHFTIEQTSRTDLAGLFTLALVIGHDSLARAVVQHRLAAARDASARQTIMEQAVVGYLAAEPARIASAQGAAAKADSLAFHESTNSLPAHVQLLDLAREAFDRRRIVDEAHQIIKLGQSLAFDAIRYQDIPVILAWQDLLEVAYLDQPDSVLALAQRAKADLARFPVAGGPDWPPGVSFSLIQRFDFKKATPPEVRDFLLPFNANRYTKLRMLPPVHATHWFPSVPPEWPPRGQLSLVLYGGWIMTCARSDMNLLVFPLRKECAPLHTTLRAWTKQYDSLGFSLVFVERTFGTAVRSELLTPKAEADSLNWYYRTYLQLPVTLGVVETNVSTKVPLPDGRLQYTDTTAFGRMLGPDVHNGLALLFKRDGTLLYAGEFDRVLLHALIKRELHFQ
jgi:hypothetical protein